MSDSTANLVGVTVENLSLPKLNVQVVRNSGDRTWNIGEEVGPMAVTL